RGCPIPRRAAAAARGLDRLPEARWPAPTKARDQVEQEASAVRILPDGELARRKRLERPRRLEQRRAAPRTVRTRRGIPPADTTQAQQDAAARTRSWD